MSRSDTKPTYTQVDRDDLLLSHRTLVDLIESLHIHTVIRDSEGNFFIHYATMATPIEVIDAK
jgi:hypothetical protein